MNACRSVWGPTGLAIPARRATGQTIRPAPCRSSRRLPAARKAVRRRGRRGPGRARRRCGAGAGGWVVKEFFLDGVLVEPGDGAQPARDGGASAAAGFQVAGEALDVGPAGGEQAHLVLLAPGRVLAQRAGCCLRSRPTRQRRAGSAGVWTDLTPRSAAVLSKAQ